MQAVRGDELAIASLLVWSCIYFRDTCSDHSVVTARHNELIEYTRRSTVG
jgi:hypothetical protein